MVPIRFEQAVYGSFPFWDRGYDVLARSPGCRPEWLAGLRDVCQRYGERPRGAAEAGGLFALRLPGGPWAIVGPSVQGTDDRGRPGALAFHALLLSPRDYRRAGCSPFALAGALRRRWGPETTSLPSGTWLVGPPGPPAAENDRARRIAAALARGRRVAVEADGPMDELAGRVWNLLPARVRRRASVATWAFGNANRFDLVALPRLAGAELDASYVDPDAEASGPGPVAGTRQAVRPRAAGLWPLLGIAAFLIASAALVLAVLRTGGGSDAPATAPETTRPAPDPASYPGARIDPLERSRVAEGLADLAERFGVAAVGAPDGDPVALMTRLAERLRDRGPVLAAEELRRLAVRDGLTGLANRTLLLDRVEQSLVAGGRSGATSGIVALGVIGMTGLNEQLGQAGGDQVLRV
ncbi:MAG TPA: GGDEF domain-containing protein, partial [Isosphaeraceae bacterium]